mgnify:CR=1 FL=1
MFDKRDLFIQKDKQALDKYDTKKKFWNNFIYSKTTLYHKTYWYLAAPPKLN